MIHTREIDHPPFAVLGLRARTTNAAEGDPATARIPALWGAFYAAGGAAGVPGSGPGALTYGVYTAYESDHRGAYDVLVGCAVTGRAAPEPGWSRHEVPGGRYLVFTGTGAMPGVMFETWAAVWAFFSARSDVRRAYTTDFEAHDPSHPDRVAIHIAITDAQGTPA